MAHIANSDFIALFKNYPFYSQEGSEDPIVIAKVFDTFGSATWFITEYDPEQNIAFCYVTGLAADEWGYTSITELESINHPDLGIPRIERDLYFTSGKFSDVVKGK